MPKIETERLSTLQRRHDNLSKLKSDISIDTERGYKIETNNELVALQLAELRESLEDLWLPSLMSRIESEYKEAAIRMVLEYYATLADKRQKFEALTEKYKENRISKAAYEKYKADFDELEKQQSSSPDLVAALNIYQKEIAASRNRSTDAVTEDTLTTNEAVEVSDNGNEVITDSLKNNTVTQLEIRTYRPDSDPLDILNSKAYPNLEVLKLFLENETVTYQAIKSLLQRESQISNFLRLFNLRLSKLDLSVVALVKKKTLRLEAAQGVDISEVKSFLTAYLADDNSGSALAESEIDTPADKSAVELNVQTVLESPSESPVEAASITTQDADLLPEQSPIEVNLKIFGKVTSFRSKLLAYFASNPDQALTSIEMQQVTENVVKTPEAIKVAIKVFRNEVSGIGLKLIDVGRKGGIKQYLLTAQPGYDLATQLQLIKNYIAENNLNITYASINTTPSTSTVLEEHDVPVTIAQPLDLTETIEANESVVELISPDVSDSGLENNEGLTQQDDSDEALAVPAEVIDLVEIEVQHPESEDYQEIPPDDDPIWNDEELFSRMYPEADFNKTDDEEADIDDKEHVEEEDVLLESLQYAYDLIAGMDIDPHSDRLIRLTEVLNGAWYGKINQTAEKFIEPTIFETFRGVRFKKRITTKGRAHYAYTFHGLVIFALALEPSTTKFWTSVGPKIRKITLKKYLEKIVK